MPGRAAANGPLGRNSVVPSRVIRVFIIADVRFYREGLQQVLSQEQAIDVIGTAAHIEEAAGRVRELIPDITLLDCATPKSPKAVRSLLDAAPGMKVVVLAISEDESQVIQWAEAGISGYVSCEAPLANLVTTIESVARDEMPCSPGVAARLVQRLGALAAGFGGGSAQPQLTHREHEIVDLIGQGLSNKEIARTLHVALPTVKNHIHNILNKLQVHSRSDAISRLGRAVRISGFQ